MEGSKGGGKQVAREVREFIAISNRFGALGMIHSARVAPVDSRD